MKPAALRPAVIRLSVPGMLLAFALGILPAGLWAQRGGAAAHAGVGRPGGIGRPAVHVPPPAPRPSAGAVGRPIGAAPAIGRPIRSGSVLTQPMIPRPGITPIAPYRKPITSGAMFLPTRLPNRFPPRLGVGGLPGSAAYFGYNPFLLRSCGAFPGFAYGCGVLPPYAGFGFNLGGIYPSLFPPVPPDTGYPSAPVYPTEQPNPPDPLATLQYSPLVNEPLPGLPPDDLISAGAPNVPLFGETLLYLKDGSVFAVASYTVSAGRLRYVTAYGDHNDVAVDDLDVQRTIQANAARGVAFTLTPAAAAAPGDSKPALLGPSPAPEGPITPAKQ